MGEKTPPKIDIKAFQSACHLAARELGCQLLGKRLIEYSVANFYSMGFDNNGARNAIIVNAHYPIVACSTYPVDHANVDIVDENKILTWFSENTDYKYPGLSLLLDNPKDEDLEVLCKAEIDQIKYWKPKAIHQIVFNCWD